MPTEGTWSTEYLDSVDQPQQQEQQRHWEHRHHEVQVPRYDHNTPVPNNVPWYFLSLSILIGAAILVRGMSMTVKRWAQALHSSRIPKIGIVVEIVSILLAVGLGAVAGYLVWNVWLGAMIAFVGSLGSPWVLDQLTGFLSRFKKDK